MKIKLKALRDEFMSRQSKISDITNKIKELSLFKLEIENDVRVILEENFSVVRILILNSNALIATVSSRNKTQN